jgi:TnpA family transposase
MIEGVVRHETSMEIDANMTDSHGQSEVGFAYAELLGFRLLPRLKRIGAQRLYLPEAGTGDQRAPLASVTSHTIDWQTIADHHDHTIRYTAAIRTGTADAEAILRRFTRNGPQHPTHRAITELGKAPRTTFLRDYLTSEQLRREIHEGLNVTETWNSANGFIFYGKGSDIASNRLHDQQLAALCLHLHQAVLVYVNTLMIQQVLDDTALKLTTTDLRALTPLTRSHVNPYDTFTPDTRPTIGAARMTQIAAHSTSRDDRPTHAVAGGRRNNFAGSWLNTHGVTTTAISHATSIDRAGHQNG